jgi:hypothetical protein
MLSQRTRELLALERRERRARFERVIKSYAAPAAADGADVTGPAAGVQRVRDALALLAEGSPGHRHLVAVALQGIDVLAAAKEGPAAAVRPAARLEGGRLKISADDVEELYGVHLAHEIVYHAALADVLASPTDLAGAAARPPAAGALGPVAHRAEEAALREQAWAIQALSGREDFRDVEAASAAIEESLKIRGLSAVAPGKGR